MFERVALVHYHEIGLKGRNRGTFERKLKDNIAFSLGDLAPQGVERVASRLVVPLASKSAEQALELISRIPGVASVADAYVTSRDPAEMERAATEAVLRAAPDASTFAVKARRSSTDYSESGHEMNVRIGAAVQAATGMAVDLGHPDVTCSIEVVQGAVYVYARRIEGPGGLPVGTSGRVVALLSAGIDSPVAAWRMIRRGAVAIALHFSGRPQTDARSEEYARDICRVLERTGGLARLYVAPFGELQREISLAAPPDLRVLLYRRLMLRVAEKIAAVEGAKALVTGESLGQVASQTLDNIAAVDAVASMPVLRPLIGNDKLEIMAEARAIGTYELSTQPHTDCCTLFMPRNPATHATIEQVEAGEAGLDIDRMVDAALAGLSWTTFACASYRPPAQWREG
ncbi:MAG: tRNA uracil 4-sulfurtransferase ThiI [Coriobacteriales bacterium]